MRACVPVFVGRCLCFCVRYSVLRGLCAFVCGCVCSWGAFLRGFGCVEWVLVCVFVPGVCVCSRPGRGELQSIKTRKPRNPGFTNTTPQDERGSGGGGACRLPEWFPCRFVLMRRRRKERSSHTESTRGIRRGYWRGHYRTEFKATAQTLHRHGVSSPVQSVTHTFEHAQLAHKHAHSPSDSRSLPPSLSSSSHRRRACGLLACFSRHLRCGAGRWHERRPDQRGACL
jgi:hypothetical protein